MTYTKRIPEHQRIVRLSTLVKQYPVTRSEVVKVARSWNFEDDVISFLRLFPAGELFESRTDLVTRTEELALLIRQEWESPREHLLNP